MTAAYPTTVKSFTTKTDFTDTVLAEHVNSLQLEVTSIETVLGTSILTGSGLVGTFDVITSSWNTLKDRLANIEYGLKDVYDEHVSNVGGSTIVPSGASVKGLVVKGAVSQSSSLVEFQTSAGTVVSKVDSAGEIYTSDKKLVPIVYASSQPSSVPAGTIWVDSTSDVAVSTSQTFFETDEGVLVLMGAIV